MIQYRDSIAELTPASIRQRVHDLDIFLRYCPGFKRPGLKFRSPFRKDPTPSAIISPSTSRPGIYWYTDFGERAHSFDSISFVMMLYGMTFREAMLRIDIDFGLGLSGGAPLSSPSVFSPSSFRQRNPCNIQVRFRQWRSVDTIYWEQFLLTKKDVLDARIRPIDYYWINTTRINAPELCYVFLENAPRLKIYSPLDLEAKWWSSTTAEDLQGIRGLPTSGDRLVITSSLKDVLCLRALGFHSMAPQSESVKMSEKVISHLRRRFSKIQVLFDNDPGGHKGSAQLCQAHGLTDIRLPDGKFKDVAEMIEVEGPYRTRLAIIRASDEKDQIQIQVREQEGTESGTSVPF